LPAGWAEVSFDDAIVVVSDRGQRIKQKNYLEDGALAVVDQGEGLVGGYTDDVSAQVEHVPPVILFGDHTRRFKYVTFPFAVGADGVKLFAPTDLHDPEFLFYQLGTIDLENRGYGRHYQYLRKETLRIPPKSEQTRIVEKLEGLLSDLDAGVAELKAAQRKLAQYRQSLLKAAVEGALTADWRVARARTGEPQESGAELLQRIPHRTPRPLGGQPARPLRRAGQDPAQRLAGQVQGAGGA
jgi:type I restriction enzyme S subunit